MGKSKNAIISTFYNKLVESKLGEVQVDFEEGWVDIKIGNKHLSIVFDSKGNKIEDIGVYKDIVEVTGQKRIL